MYECDTFADDFFGLLWAQYNAEHSDLDIVVAVCLKLTIVPEFKN